MNDYLAPVEDQIYALEHIAGISALIPGDGTVDEKRGLLCSILEQSVRLAENIFAPLNRTGDTVGATLADGEVSLPPGFVPAYAAYAAGGWSGIGAKPELGGMGFGVAICAPTMRLFDLNADLLAA
jgi:hypothetical protein